MMNMKNIVFLIVVVMIAVAAVPVTRAKSKIDLAARGVSIGINNVGVADLAVTRGTVRFYNEKKKFGFITPEDGSADIYFDKGGLIDKVKTGDLVEFDTATGTKGAYARNIRLR